MSATELAKAYVQIVPSADGITDGIASIVEPEAERAGQSSGSKFSGGFSSGIASAAQIGVGAIGAIAAASTAATGALVSGVGSVAEYGDNIDKMSQKIGELQKLEDGFVKSGARGRWIKRKEPPTDEQKEKWKAARLRYQAKFLEIAEKHGGEH